jgi:hypothetical protein
LDGFRRSADAQLKAQMAGVAASIPLVLDKSNFQAQLQVVKAQLADLGRRRAQARVDLDDKAAVASLARWDLRLARLDRKVAKPEITVRGVEAATVEVLAWTRRWTSSPATRPDPVPRR